MPRQVSLRVCCESGALGSGQGAAGHEAGGAALPPSSHQSPQPPREGVDLEPRGKWLVQKQSPHPASPSGPSILSGEARGLKPRPLILPPAKPGSRGHPRGAGCPGGSWGLGPWWGCDSCSARKVRRPLWPHLAGTWTQARSHPALEFTLPSLTGGLSGADSSPHSSPCQIVLNYNDKPWQASMATSQQKERDKHPTS